MIRAVFDRGRSFFYTINRWVHVALFWQRRRFPRAVIALAGIGLIILLGPVAQWATPVSDLRGKELADAINSTRQVLLAAAGGLVVVVGLVFTGRTYYLTRRGQLTDRYGKAITQLASDKITERLGGIYALEHVMRESEDDHHTIVDVLAAFIRERVPRKDVETHAARIAPSSGEPPELPAWVPRPPTDVRAALAVLNRRPQRIGRLEVNLELTELRGAELPNAWLPYADLHGAQLHLAWLARANLVGANLQGTQLTAYLHNAHLQYANLQDARMSGAQLNGANMRQCRLMRATLSNASLVNAQLQDADLSNADLKEAVLDGAQLQGANLTGVIGLTAAQLATAALDDTTRLPIDLASAIAERGPDDAAPNTP